MVQPRKYLSEKSYTKEFPIFDKNAPVCTENSERSKATKTTAQLTERLTKIFPIKLGKMWPADDFL